MKRCTWCNVPTVDRDGITICHHCDGHLCTVMSSRCLFCLGMHLRYRDTDYQRLLK